MSRFLRLVTLLFAAATTNTMVVVAWQGGGNTLTPRVTKTFRSTQSRLYHSTADVTTSLDSSVPPRKSLFENRRREWHNRSVSYYSKVMREERRRALGQIDSFPKTTDEYKDLAQKHYFALRKIKEGQWSHAENIYRRILNDILQHDELCDYGQAAVTTLLLALLTQRMKDPKKTRAVFVNFFRLVVSTHEDKECACSAKVLQAFALFEMKQGNARKSLEIVRRAVKLDPSLMPVLNWKQFREASKRDKQLRANSSSP